MTSIQISSFSGRFLKLRNLLEPQVSLSSPFPSSYPPFTTPLSPFPSHLLLVIQIWQNQQSFSLLLCILFSVYLSHRLLIYFPSVSCYFYRQSPNKQTIMKTVIFDFKVQGPDTHDYHYVMAKFSKVSRNMLDIDEPFE